MKRFAWILATAVVLVVVAVGLTAALLPRDSLKTQLGEQIASWTGRDVSLGSGPTISLFPPLTVTLDDVRISGPAGMNDAQILSMDRLRGTIRLLPLIIGRVEIKSFTMVRPLIRLVRDKAGTRNWEFNSGAAALQLAFAGDVPLGKFTLEQGTVLYEDRASGDKERLDSVNLSVDWTSVRNPVEVDGSGIWRGEQVTFSGSAKTPFAYFKGGATPLAMSIDAAPISISFDGEAQNYPHTDFSGALKLNAPSLRRFLSWLGSPIGPGSTLAQASLSGSAAFSNDVLSVENAQFTLDGNRASGALKITAGAKPGFAGTLAFDTLDLTPYFAGLSAALALGPDWRRVPLPTDWFADMAADIRLSANAVTLGSLTAANTAASVSLRDGRLEIGLARAVLDEGSLAGDLAVANSASASGADVEAQLRANAISLADAAAFLGLPDGVTGLASGAVDLTATGGNLGALIGSLGGTARMHVEQGKVPLFGIAEIATANDVSGSTAADGLAPTPVQSAAVRLSFSGGVGNVDQARVVTSSYSADASGWVKLADGSLGLNGTLRPGAPGSPAGAVTPFTIGGTVGQPVTRRQAQAN